jgi:uncharacterized protein with von Willebrand factor type A (vWA) domain
MGAAHGLTAHLARFAGALRGEGVRVGIADEIDAASALRLVDLFDRGEVERVLRIAFKVPRDAWAVFGRLFEDLWAGNVDAPPQRKPPRHEAVPLQWRWDGERVRLTAGEPAESPIGDTPSYSPEALLRHKPFDQISAAELAAMQKLIERFARRIAIRRSRRLVPTRGRGTVDLRRSFRRALAGDGDLLRLARRARAVEEPSLVVLYDTSGSMEAYTRFLLVFAFALRRVIRRVEIFAFNTTLVRVTRMIEPARIDLGLHKLTLGVPDWSGGTRIGACLAEFAERHGAAMIGRDTTLIVLSDGLDHGDGAVLGGAMRELRGRARKIVWLNPLLGDPRYRPEAAGMRAALPFVDHFGSAHNLESMEGLLRRVA